MAVIVIIILLITLIAVAIFTFKAINERNKLAGEIFKLWRDQGESKDDPLYLILLEYGYFD